jgi:glutamate dehydrogenase (NAD(P)+)
VEEHLPYKEGVAGSNPAAPTEVDVRLRDLMSSAYSTVATTGRDRDLSLRQAAHVVGVGRVSGAVRLRGLHP